MAYNVNHVLGLVYQASLIQQVKPLPLSNPYSFYLVVVINLHTITHYKYIRIYRGCSFAQIRGLRVTYLATDTEPVYNSLEHTTPASWE